MKTARHSVLQAGLLLVLAGAFYFLGQWQRKQEEAGALARASVKVPVVVKSSTPSIPPGLPPQVSSPTRGAPAAQEPLSPGAQAAARANDPERALNSLRQRPPNQTPVALGTTLILASRSSDPTAVPQYIGAIPDEATRNRLIARLAPVLGANSQQGPAVTLDWLKQVASGETYSGAVGKIITDAAGKDPAAAAAVLGKITDPGVFNTAVGTVAASWGKADPQAALAWAQTLPDSSSPAALNAVVTAWAKGDPGAAAAYVQKSTDSSVYLSADPSIAQSLAATSPQAALAFSNSLPAGEAKNQALNNVIVTIAKTDFTTAWQEAVTLPADGNRDTVMDNLVVVQAKKDPAQAATLIPLFPDAAGQAAATTALAAVWVKQDPQAFTVWLDSLPVGSARDAAIVELASSVQATKDPVGVMAWVNTVSNPQLKAQWVQKLAQVPAASGP